MSNILYIEDDQEIGEFVYDILEQKGHRVIWLTSSYQYEQHIEAKDIVILDVMMPGLDGFTVGQRIKEMHIDIPILLLTARTAMEDKLKGLEFADDYITKPFHPEELIARIEVLLRRFNKHPMHELVLHHLQIHLQEKRIINRYTAEEIFLTDKQFKIFILLLNHPNQILTKEQIYENIWNQHYMEGDKTLMVHIRYLRQKIEENPNKPIILETIRGIGYRIKQ
ncbi:response regulator transcription factor [Paenibacillus kyungheensis]|uniref:Response regulator transcription factor n=1 Tax=Paenibacillus kyungheensis TaxID=1452732 RepID=A0AAX3M0W7_9BACL|nr:response regulator transcription factor [Paenibacillus kyungheensis]WCT55545.1 response regulator transcription factor [Paenibacillus kyungheensis]